MCPIVFNGTMAKRKPGLTEQEICNLLPQPMSTDDELESDKSDSPDPTFKPSNEDKALSSDSCDDTND